MGWRKQEADGRRESKGQRGKAKEQIESKGASATLPVPFALVSPYNQFRLFKSCTMMAMVLIRVASAIIEVQRL